MVLEKCLQPKNPRLADKGLGCTDISFLCNGLVIISAFLWAYAPQSRKTTGASFLLSSDITLSVKVSHPILAWLVGCPSRTVSTAFKSSTPCFAQSVSSPWEGISLPTSEFSSLKIFLRLGGGITPFFTEKQSPCA